MLTIKKIQKIYFFIFFCGLLTNQLLAQGIPNTPFHLHNFNNYPLLNPAATGLPPLFGIPEDPLFFFTHHRQQIGAFDNVPIYTSMSFNKNFNAETPTPNSWGGNLYNFRRSIWQTTGGWLAYARELKVNAFGLPVNNLRLGLSMGVEADGFNIDDDQLLTDPAIVNRRDKPVRPVGQFGFLYVFGGRSGTSVWELGGGLPRLFKTSKLDNTISGFYPIANWFLSISRQIQTQKLQNWYMKPMAIFRTFDNKEQVLEINNMLNYYEGVRHHWIGGSWVQNYGFAAIVGTKFYKSKFGISYAYKFNGEKAGFNKNPVHEIQLIYNLRRLSKIEERGLDIQDKAIDSTIYDDEVVMDSVLVEDTLILAKQDTVREVMVNPDTLTDAQRKELKNQDYKNYVVVGSFIVKGNADRMLRNLKARYAVNGRVRFNKANKFYNVYILETDDFDEAEKMEQRAETEMGIGDAWLLRVPKSPPPDK